MTAATAPLFSASDANLLPSKFSPRIAKNMHSSLTFLLSVETAGNFSKSLYNSSVLIL
jgi:hypothetical protein